MTPQTVNFHISIDLTISNFVYKKFHSIASNEPFREEVHAKTTHLVPKKMQRDVPSMYQSDKVGCRNHISQASWSYSNSDNYKFIRMLSLVWIDTDPEPEVFLLFYPFNGLN